MQLDMPKYLETRRDFLANRAAFPPEELEKYAGKWIAWSPDGKRVAAVSSDAEGLDELLKASGEDPVLCVIEGIPDDERIVGAVEESGE